MTKTMNNTRQGFTLVEMLVVLGILGIISAALLSSFSHVQRAARKSQAQSQVSEVAVAFTLLLQKERLWPQEWLDQNKREMDEEVCWVFQDSKLLDVTSYLYDSNGKVKPKSDSNINKQSLDRFGMLDPWGRRELKKNQTQTPSAQVSTGGTFADHRIQFRLDEDYDGWIDSSEGLPGKGGKVRASVVVWSRGPDGKDDLETVGKPIDDSLSWPYNSRY